MFRKSSLATRLLTVIAALAVIPLLWPASVSAGWWHGMFRKNKKPKYEPVQLSPHCQQYYGHFPTCWRIFPQDFQNCPPGEICPVTPTSPQMMPHPADGQTTMPANVPEPAPAVPGDETAPVAPPEAAPPEAPPAVPYEEPNTTNPDAAPKPGVRNPVPDASEEAGPEFDQNRPEEAPGTVEPPPAVEGDSSSSQFLPPVQQQSELSSPGWTPSPHQREQAAIAPRQPLVQLESIETGEDDVRTAAKNYHAQDIAVSHRNQDASSSQFPTSADPLQVPLHADGEVAELLQALRDPASPNRHKSVYKLGLMAADASDAVPALTVLLNDSDAKVRMHAALALWRITGKTQFAVPTLASGLDRGQGSVQSLAAVALGEIGPAAQKAVPTLVSATEDAETPEKLQAAEALWKVVGKNANSIAVLAKSLNDSDPEVRWVAAYALSEIAPKSQVVVKSLAARLEDENASVREVSAFALGTIGRTAKIAVPQLLEAMNDPSSGVADAATRALLLIDP